MEQIIVEVAPDGGLKIDAVGFRGADCEKATKFLEAALGRITRRQPKPEYHQTRQTRPQQRLGR